MISQIIHPYPAIKMSILDLPQKLYERFPLILGSTCRALYKCINIYNRPIIVTGSPLADYIDYGKIREIDLTKLDMVDTVIIMQKIKPEKIYLNNLEFIGALNRKNLKYLHIKKVLLDKTVAENITKIKANTDIFIDMLSPDLLICVTKPNNIISSLRGVRINRLWVPRFIYDHHYNIIATMFNPQYYYFDDLISIECGKKIAGLISKKPYIKIAVNISTLPSFWESVMTLCPDIQIYITLDGWSDNIRRYPGLIEILHKYEGAILWDGVKNTLQQLIKYGEDEQIDPSNQIEQEETYVSSDDD